MNCPFCDGVRGWVFVVYMRHEAYGSWGDNDWELGDGEVISQHNAEPCWVRCLDCGKRIRIEDVSR